MAAELNQYLRAWAIQINGQPFIDNNEGRQFRCLFDVLVSPGNSLARADIQIYNLSRNTTINQRDDITLSAGYQGSYDLIFVGTVTNVFKERRGPDVVTRLLCSTIRRGTMTSPYGAGAKLVDVLKDIAKTWPRTLEIDESQFTEKDIFPAGYTAYGDIPYQLNSLKQMFDFEWVDDRGSLVITRPDKERTSTVFDVNQFTGMVGIPEVTRGIKGLGVRVDMRINPFIRINSRIKVSSEFSTYDSGYAQVAEYDADASANGEYNVFSLQYVGDTHGGQWDVRIDAIRAGTAQPLPSVGGGSLVWGARVEPEFRAKVREIAQRQNLDPNWYMAVMAFETGNTFSPSVKNAKGSGATGLIQFMPTTARDMGTSTQALANMSRTEQLDWVEKYFQPHAARIRSIDDMYMAVFWPAAIGKSGDYVLIDRDTNPVAYNQNSNLDINRDGKITKNEAASRVRDSFKEGEAHMV